MDAYELLNNGGPGCPGETARVMMREYIKYSEGGKYNDREIIKKVLFIRNLGFQLTNGGGTLITDDEIETVIEYSYGYFPFAIFVDILFSHIRGTSGVGLNGVMENFYFLTQVINDNYNDMTSNMDSYVYRKHIDLVNSDLKKYIDEVIHGEECDDIDYFDYDEIMNGDWDDDDDD